MRLNWLLVKPARWVGKTFDGGKDRKEFVMAIKDFETIDVAPEDEKKTVQVWMSFGWELKNTERIKTQDVQKYTGQDRDGTKYYQTTKGDDFVKLTFERDPERKNYAELKALEKQYYAKLPSFQASSPGAKPKKPGVFSLIMTVIGLVLGTLLLVSGIFASEVSFILFGVVFLVLGIRGVIRRTSFPSKLKSWEARNEVYQSKHSEEEKALSEAKKKRDDALEKARSLV